MFRHIQCDICGSSSSRLISRIKVNSDDINLHEFVGLFCLVCCDKCGLIYVNPQPVFTRDDMEKLYSERYFSKEYMRFYDAGQTDAVQSNEAFAWRLDLIKQYKTKGNLLDIGCASGGFLAEAQKRGWEVSGVEISQYAARLATQKCKCKIAVGTLEDAHLNDASFDVVSAGDILEHVSSPSNFLLELKRVLKNDGIAYIAVPNAASFYYTFFALLSKWNHKNYFVLPHHLYLFSPLTIRKALEKAGFDLLELRFSHSRSPSWWMNIFNFHDRLIAIAKKKRCS